MQKVSKSHRDWQGSVGPVELVPEIVVGRQLDRLRRGDEKDVHPAAPVHSKVALKKSTMALFVMY